VARQSTNQNQNNQVNRPRPEKTHKTGPTGTLPFTARACRRSRAFAGTGGQFQYSGNESTLCLKLVIYMEGGERLYV